MQVGNTISVAALNVTIIDADGFTRDFYDAKQMSLLPAISIIVTFSAATDIVFPTCKSVQ